MSFGRRHDSPCHPLGQTKPRLLPCKPGELASTRSMGTIYDIADAHANMNIQFMRPSTWTHTENKTHYTWTPLAYLRPYSTALARQLVRVSLYLRRRGAWPRPHTIHVQLQRVVFFFVFLMYSFSPCCCGLEAGRVLAFMTSRRDIWACSAARRST